MNLLTFCRKRLFIACTHGYKAILDFTHSAMSKIISGHSTMLGISGNAMVHTSIMNRRIFYQKVYQIYFSKIDFLCFTSKLVKFEEDSQAVIN